METKNLTAQELLADEQLWSLYHASFPPEETEETAVICRGISSGKALMLRACDGQNLVGFINVHLLRNPDSVFIVYLAVDPNYRGKGFGERLVEAAYALGTIKLAFDEQIPLWAEIDSLSLATTEEEKRVRSRRQAFFEKMGLVPILQQSYVQPPVDGNNLVPMTLVVRHGPEHERENEREHELPSFEAHIRNLYRQKYHEVNGISLEKIKLCWKACKFSSDYF
ncbi:MAG: GNAT family N-acetyltransferase [Oligoflexia bacterium]|nr:GNAT family N-acetyltransferase [Oligoflexia bacterium]